jgi:hypothetical protein
MLADMNVADNLRTRFDKGRGRYLRNHSVVRSDHATITRSKAVEPPFYDAAFDS